MFNILRDGSLFYIQSGAYTSPPMLIKRLVHALIAIGTDKREIYEGIMHMMQNDHDFANFGTSKTFIFSCNKGFSRKAAA